MKMPTLHSILASLPSAATWSFRRGHSAKEGSLSIQHESLADDRRTCTDVYFQAHRVEIRVAVLSGFDPKKDKWTRYESDQKGDLPTRAGEKALRAYIAAYALKKTGYPNPVSVSYYADMDNAIQESINRAAVQALA